MVGAHPEKAALCEDAHLGRALFAKAHFWETRSLRSALLNVLFAQFREKRSLGKRSLRKALFAKPHCWGSAPCGKRTLQKRRKNTAAGDVPLEWRSSRSIRRRTLKTKKRRYPGSR